MSLRTDLLALVDRHGLSAVAREIALIGKEHASDVRDVARGVTGSRVARAAGRAFGTFVSGVVDEGFREVRRRRR